MSDFTPKIGLWQLISLQGDAYALYNESLFRTELFAAGVVRSRTSGVPPDPIVDGDAYIVPSGALGVWSGKTDRIQLGLNNAWLDIAPASRVRFWVEDEDVSIRYFGSGWVEEEYGGGGGVQLDDVNIFTKTQTVDPVALTDAATIAVDGALSNTFTVTLGGNRTMGNPSNLQNGAVYNFHVQQRTSGSPVYTLAWGSAYKGTILALNTTLSGYTWYAFQVIGSNLIFAGAVNYSV